MESQQTDVKEYSYFAGNQWRKNPDNQTFEVHEPYSGKLFARVAAGTRAMRASPWTRQPKRSQPGPLPRRPKELVCS
jgi:hypothetical protein